VALHVTSEVDRCTFASASSAAAAALTVAFAASASMAAVQPGESAPAEALARRSSAMSGEQQLYEREQRSLAKLAKSKPFEIRWGQNGEGG
jgi:hypothetical protein